MEKRKSKPVEILKEEENTPLPFDNSEFKKIALCLGVIATRLTHLKYKKDGDRISFLSKLGFDRHEIAAILDTTPLTVSVTQTNLKKKTKRKVKSNVEDQ